MCTTRIVAFDNYIWDAKNFLKCTDNIINVNVINKYKITIHRYIHKA